MKYHKEREKRQATFIAQKQKYQQEVEQQHQEQLQETEDAYQKREYQRQQRVIGIFKLYSLI